LVGGEETLRLWRAANAPAGAAGGAAAAGWENTGVEASFSDYFATIAGREAARLYAHLPISQVPESLLRRIEYALIVTCGGARRGARRAARELVSAFILAGGCHHHGLSVKHSLEVSERKVSRVWNLAAVTSGSNTSKGNGEQRDEKSELHGLRVSVILSR